MSSRQNTRKPAPVAMTVAGSDSGGGAGIQADLLTFAAFGVFGTTAITCLTAQNPEEVRDVLASRPSMVLKQMEAVAHYFRLGALKTGMLFDAGIIRVVARFLEQHPGIPAVVDPVMISTSGARLLKPRAIRAMEEELFPRAAVLTPNLDECAALTGVRPRSPREAAPAAAALARRYAVPVLLKGGHLPGSTIIDILAFPDGTTREFRGERVSGVNTHGSGCTLSAAIAANLALGHPLEASILRARRYLCRGLRKPIRIGRSRFIAHS